jgi:serine/threonine protein kinase/Tol biopolymer transport system component
METDRWRRLQDLYHAASALPAAQRVSFLDGSCDGDGALREEVESLLAHHTREKDFLEENAVHVAARLIARDQSDVQCERSGTTIGHFEILGKLGHGGMGVVFEALDTRLGRTVALKFLPATVASDAKALERLQREARAASALNHPNICTIYSIQEAGGRLFIEMERLEGQTLRERIADKPLDAADAVALGLQILDGLETAHGKGIVHRDLKPGNVFCTTRGTAKILDFGIATLESAPALETAAAIGTDGYMSPEQASGQSVDSRTDLFSFGALLYETVTGRAAFQGRSSASIRHAILHDDPVVPRSLNPAVPPALERIIFRSLQKNREQRYQRASEIRADLERLQHRARRRQRNRIAIAMLFVMLSAATALYYSLRDARDLFANVRVRQLTHNASEDSVRSGALSPDGRYLAYTDARGIHVQAVETDEVRTVPESANLPNGVTWDVGAGWLADGSGLVVNLLPGTDVARSSVWLVGTSGPPRKIRDHAQALCVSPDGSWIAFAADGRQHHYRSIWLIDQKGRSAHHFFAADTGSSIAGLSWSPDGHRVVYLRADASGGGVAIETRDVAGGSASTILRTADGAVHGPVWLRDGRLLYSLERSSTTMEGGTQPCTHWQMPVSPTGQPLGKPTQLARWLPQCVGSLNFSADGRRAAYFQTMLDDAIHVADLDGEGNVSSSARRLTFTEGRNIPSGWTPDSRSLVFVSDSDGRPTLFRQSINGDTPQPISHDPGIMGFARVTPDGEWVIYRRESSGGVRLMLVSIAGGVSREFATGMLVEGGVRCAVFPGRMCVIAERSGGGREVVFSSIDTDSRRGPELARVNADPDTDYRWALSPDGRRVAFFGATDPKIHILSTTGVLLQDLEVPDRKSLGYVSWTSDGKQLLVPNVAGGVATLLSVDLHGNTRVLWRQAGAIDISAIPSPDGRHIAVWVRNLHANFWLVERPD